MDDNNTNLDPMEETDPQKRTIILTMVGVIGVGFCALFLIAFLWFQPGETSLFAKYFPSPTPTLTLTPTPNFTATANAFQATAISAQDQWPVNLSESFDANNHNWYVGTDDTQYAKTKYEIKDGKYRWDAMSHKGFIQWVRFSPTHFTDFYVTAEGQKTVNPTLGNYGIIFREDAFNNYYYFAITSNGGFFVSLYNKEKWNNIIDWTASGFIQPGKPNRLTVVGEGSHFIFLINGEYVGEMNDDHLAKGRIGLAVELYDADAQGIFEFDNIELRVPAPPATPTSTITPTPTITATLTITLTPHALIPALDSAKVFNEQFETNKNGWVRHNSRTSTASVKEGKLVVRSDKIGYFGVASCLGCPVFDAAYYFQAEVATATNTFAWHGLLFCAHPNRLTGYYIFEIDSQNQFYMLQKNSNKGWSTLVQPNRAKIINKFPLSNTLAVLYDHGKIDMYINGTFVHTYTPADELQCRNVGFIVQEGQIDLVIDNVFAYRVEDTATPPP